MKYYIITITDHAQSEAAAQNCIESTNLPIEKFMAVTPSGASKMLRGYGIEWKYPWDKTEIDFASGLQLTPYKTANRDARIACFLSHYTLWKECVESNEPMLILEHDAIFKSTPDFDSILNSKFEVVGINNPIGATRKSKVYHEMIQANPEKIQPVPTIDDHIVPQGLAGNSAYIIKPKGAKRLISLVNTFGAWPNDAIMCKQLFGGKLGVTKKYYTEVQGTRSTTTL